MAKRKRVELVKIVVDGVEVDAKECTKCGEVKALTEFAKERARKDGRDVKCKACARVISRMWYKNNLSKRKEYEKSRLKIVVSHRMKRRGEDSAYHSHILNYRREWERSNPEKIRLYSGTRRALKYHLPGDLVELEWFKVKAAHNHNCALTNCSSEVTQDHWIPLSIGHCGNHAGNVYPLVGKLNYSMSASNPFEWFEANRQRFDLEQSALDALVVKLAQQNGLTSEEFRSFTYWCFANQRSIDEVRADNERYGYKRLSLDIWREAIGLPFPMRVDFGDPALDHALAA